jgi:hypothetical protein
MQGALWWRLAVADCYECLRNVPYMANATAYHLTYDGHAEVCKRGPIERELREIVWVGSSIVLFDRLSDEAFGLILGAGPSLHGRPYFQKTWALDHLSAAIEAAAELGL